MEVRQSIAEEKWNAWSHGIGVALACVGVFFLFFNNESRTTASWVSIAVYSGSLIILYTASTLYHGINKRSTKQNLRIFDHASIYLLIAGTYTPICLISLEKHNGWTIFFIVWAIAIIGVVLKLFFTGKFEKLSLLLYLAMGWLIMFDIGSLQANMSGIGFFMLCLGGFFYSAGTIFYAINRIRFNHVIWHFFVLGGSISHWFMVFAEVS